MAGRRPDIGAVARDRGPGCRPDGRLDSIRPEATVRGTGGVPRRRRATRLLRLRQYARSTGREPSDDQGCARGGPPCICVPWVGRRDTAGQRTRLHFHRRSKPAGALQAGRRGSTPRWRGHHHRCRAGRSTPGRRASDVRPALLGKESPPPRDRHGARAGSAHCRLADRRLSHALQLDVAARVRTIAASVRTDGAEIAARRLIHEVSRSALGNEFPHVGQTSAGRK